MNRGGHGALRGLALLLVGSLAAASASGDRYTPTLHLEELPGQARSVPENPTERLCRAKNRVDDAERQLAEASRAYAEMRRNDYPRGDQRELVKQWRIHTRAELEAAKQDFAAAFEEVDRREDAEERLTTCPVPAAPAPEPPGDS